MLQNSSKKASSCYQCEKCSSFILKKDIQNHNDFCHLIISTKPGPKTTFINNQVLQGILDVKSSEDIKNLSIREKDGLVFLSQEAMQLCDFSIGEFVVVEPIDKTVAPLVQKVWPTNEKSLVSILLTKNCLENSNFTRNDIYAVQKLALQDTAEALQISLVILNGPKSLEISSELNNRLSKAYEGRYLTEGNLVHVMFYGTLLKFDVKLIEKKIDLTECLESLSLNNRRTYYSTNSNTKWKIFNSQESYKNQSEKTSLFNIAGLDAEIDEIQEMINAKLKKSKINQFIQSNSVVLYGNSGTGKTTLAQMLAQQSRANVIEMYAPDLYSKHSSNPEEVIKELFQNATDNSPSVIIIDEIDILCPTRNGRITDSEKRIVSTVLTCIDELAVNKNSRVFIIATTNKIDNIDPAFRRCGRLDREVEIPTPNPKTRKLILQKLLTNVPQNISENDYQEISMTTHGFVGADLVSLCAQANLISSRRNADKIELNDLKLALRKVRPSAMREVQIEIPNVKWTDIGGQENLKLILRQAVEWPLKYADSFVRLGVTPPKGVLMFGPPGCSKTMIAKALATESGLNFLSIKGPELFNKWVGESEKAIREVFRKARQVAPSIVFFDEIDALGGERSSGSSTSVQERVLAQLLTELDGVTPLGDVTILAATNRPDKIDKALLRPGRLDRIVYVPLPDDSTRREIFRIKLTKMPTQNVSIDDLVLKTTGYSGAEVNAVCHEAAMMALEEDLQSSFVEARHFDKALKMVTPRTPESLIKLYKDYINVKI